MADKTFIQEEIGRVLGNPDNMIVSDSLLDRLPGPKEAQDCWLIFDDHSFSGECYFLEFTVDTVSVTLSLHSEEEKLNFIKENFPKDFFDNSIKILIKDKLNDKILSGMPKSLTYDFAASSSCIMSLKLYNYILEVPNE